MTPRSVSVLAVLLLAGGASVAGAQGASAGKAAKAVWESVSYAEDIEFSDVFFVSRDVGWVSGAGGTILHTKDGGKSWEPQLGGDPKASDPEIKKLRFFDERHGWAVQGPNLLRTTDGASWEEIGLTPNAMGGWGDYAFVSPTTGFALAAPGGQGFPDRVFTTTDGGRTWKPVTPCEVKAVIEGLTKQIRCVLTRIQFPTASVGYAIGMEGHCPNCGVPVLGKTLDGGKTWSFALGPGNPKIAVPKQLFFFDDRRGFVQTHEGTAHKLYATNDGGETWRGIVTTPGTWLRFADPQVGWSLGSDHVAYTANGGARWSSQDHDFPAYPYAFSFPRRDRAYVVGAHGMIMRYRVLPAAEAAAKGASSAPLMPAFATSLESEAEEVVELVETLGAAAPTAGGAGEESEDDTAAEDSGEKTAAVGGEEKARAAKLNKLDLLLTALGKTVPSFLDQFTNLNVLAARIRGAGELPSRLSQLKTAVAAVRKANDRSAAQSALAQVLGAANGLYAAAAVATQKKLPAEGPALSAGSADGRQSASEEGTSEDGALEEETSEEEE